MANKIIIIVSNTGEQVRLRSGTCELAGFCTWTRIILGEFFDTKNFVLSNESIKVNVINHR